MGKVTVKEVYNNKPNSIGPYQINFQHAELSTELAGRDLSKYFQAKVFKHVKKSYLEKSDTPTGKQTVVLSSNEMTYTGSPKGSLDQTPAMGAMKTYIGIKRKKGITFHEVTPVTMSPFIRSHSFIEEKEKDTSVKTSTEDRRQAEAELIKAFGSKKKKQYLDHKEKNTVTDMNTSIEAAASEAKWTNTPTELRDTSYLTLIPPCNREAKVVSEVYNLEDLLTTEELELLEPQAKKCLQCSQEDIQKWQKADTFSDYFYATLKTLQNRRDDPKNLLSMQLVLYTEILIKLYKLPYRMIRKKIPDFPSEFPVPLVHKVFDSFTTVNALNVRDRSDELKDKVCCYIMVLVVLANNFIFDMSLMSTIFQIHVKKLLLLIRAVGISVKYNASSREYKCMLKVPLPPPVEKRGRTKQRRN